MWVSFITILVMSLVKKDYFLWIIHMSHHHTSHGFFKWTCHNCHVTISHICHVTNIFVIWPSHDWQYEHQSEDRPSAAKKHLLQQRLPKHAQALILNNFNNHSLIWLNANKWILKKIVSPSSYFNNNAFHEFPFFFSLLTTA